MAGGCDSNKAECTERADKKCEMFRSSLPESEKVCQSTAESFGHRAADMLKATVGNTSLEGEFARWTRGIVRSPCF